MDNVIFNINFFSKRYLFVNFVAEREFTQHIVFFEALYDKEERWFPW